MAVSNMIKQMSNYRGPQPSPTAGKSLANRFSQAGLSLPGELAPTKGARDGYMKSRLATHQAQERAGGLKPSTPANSMSLQDYYAKRYGPNGGPPPLNPDFLEALRATGYNGAPHSVGQPAAPQQFSASPPGVQAPSRDAYLEYMNQARERMGTNRFMQPQSAFERMQAESMYRLLQNRHASLTR